MRRLASYLTAGALFIGTAAAASLPNEFIGIWTSDTSNQCTKGDWKGVARSDSDALLSVSRDAIEFFEEGCKILNSSKRNINEVEVELSCSGYGMTWRKRELWHVGELNRRKLFVTVLLGTYYVRADAAKPIRNPNDSDADRVGVYLECK